MAADVTLIMCAAGAISYVDVLKNADGRSKGCATVVFETEEAADKAISKL